MGMNILDGSDGGGIITGMGANDSACQIGLVRVVLRRDPNDHDRLSIQDPPEGPPEWISQSVWNKKEFDNRDFMDWHTHKYTEQWCMKFVEKYYDELIEVHHANKYAKTGKNTFCQEKVHKACGVVDNNQKKHKRSPPGKRTMMGTNYDS